MLSAPVAAAAEELPLSGFGDIAVDDAHERVFVSGGPSSNGIVVTDFSGRVRRTIENQPGAHGLELSADGTRLYVALSAGDGISVIDTATLTETARYGTGAGTCPTHLARTGDLVWFGYGCSDGNWAGKIGKLDPAAAEPVAGDTLFSAAGGRDRVEAFATGDLARRGAYAARPRPGAVSMSPDGAHVAAGTLTTDGNDVLVYEVCGVTPVNTVSLDSGETVLPRGLAWSADQDHLFILTRHDNAPEPHLEIERDPTDD